GVRVSATGESFNVTGNTMLDSSLIPQSLYANDAGDGINISNATTPGHGTVSLNSINGNFIYTPAAAYTGTDSFTYTITNGFVSSTATVNLTVANKVWYIDGSSVAGTADGRSATPFKTLLAFTSVNDGAGGHPADNDLILLRDGSYTDGLVLR